MQETSHSGTVVPSSRTGAVTTSVFEEVIVPGTLELMQQGAETVTLDFRKVTWIDLSEIVSLLALSDYCKAMGCPVTFLFSLPEHVAKQAGKKDAVGNRLRRAYFALHKWDFMEKVNYEVETPKGRERRSSGRSSSAAYRDLDLLDAEHFMMPVVGVGNKSDFEFALKKIEGELSHFLKQTGHRETEDVQDLTSVILHEICENVHVHNLACSHFASGYVSFRFYRDGLTFAPRRTGRHHLLWEFLRQHLNRPFFEVAVADNGFGIVETIRHKDPTAHTKKDAEVLLGAFEKHLFPGVSGTRRGLYDVASILQKWQGILRVTSGRTGLNLRWEEGKLQALPFALETSFPGTRYSILLPALERPIPEKLQAELPLYEDRAEFMGGHPFEPVYVDLSGVKQLKEVRKVVYPVYQTVREVEQNRPVLLIPSAHASKSDAIRDEVMKSHGLDVDIRNLTGDPQDVAQYEMSSGEEEEARAFELIRAAFVKLGDRPSDIVVVDVGKMPDLKTAFIERVLLRLLRHGMPRMPDRLVLFGASPAVVAAARRADDLAAELKKRRSFLVFLSQDERVRVIGPSPPVAEALEALFLRETAKRKTVHSVFQLGRRAAGGSFGKEFNELVDACGLVRALRPPGGRDTILQAVRFQELSGKILSQQFESLLERGALHSNGHFRLPSGLHGADFIESGSFLRDRPFLWRLSKRLGSAVRRFRATCLLSYSLPGITLCDHVKAQLPELDRYVVAGDYEDTSIVFGRDVEVEERVAIVTDVISTGGLVFRLASHVRARGGELAGVVAVVSVRAGNELAEISRRLKVPVEAIFLKPFERHSAEKCPLCKKGLPLVELSGLSLSPEIISERDEETLKACEERHIRNITDRQENLRDEMEFWRLVNEVKALKFGHFVRDEHHFSYFVETMRILGSEEHRARLRGKIVDAAKTITRESGTVHFIIHPANYCAAVLAEMFAGAMPARPYVLGALRRSRTEYDIPLADPAEMAGKNVVFVDDGANSGKTILEIHGLIQRYGGTCAGVFILVNRLGHAIYESFEKLFPFRFLYSLNLPVYDSITCPLCRELRDLEGELYRTGSGMLRQYLLQRIERLKPVVMLRH